MIRMKLGDIVIFMYVLTAITLSSVVVLLAEAQPTEQVPPGAGLQPATAPAGTVQTMPADTIAQLPWVLRTNALYIDQDGDGYGPGAPKGPDSDDTDKAVNTPATVAEKYTDIRQLLARRGYKPQRILYMATNGDDASAKADNPEKTYATFKRLRADLGPGDLVLVQAGHYKDDFAVMDVLRLRGKVSQPIVIMAQPGAKVVLEGAQHCIQIAESGNLVFDGFILDRQDKASGNGVRMHHCSNITLRNMEITNQFWGIKAMQDLHGMLFENMVIHSNPGEHGIYMGSRDEPNSNVIVRRCLLYHNAQQGFQHNGRVKNMVIEENVIHSNGQAGVQLMMGVCDSIVRNNLIFNNAKQGLSFYNYTSTSAAILPYPMHNNVVEHNVIWVGRHDWHEQYDTSTYAAVQFNDITSVKGGTMDGNTIRSNILVSCQGAVLEFRQERFMDKTTVQGNLLFRAGGKNKMALIGKNEVALENLSEVCNAWKDNVFSQPPFTCVQDDLYLKPDQFDFRLKP